MAEERELYPGSSQSRPIEIESEVLVFIVVYRSVVTPHIMLKAKSLVLVFSSFQRTPSLENHGSEYCHSTVEKEEMLCLA